MISIKEILDVRAVVNAHQRTKLEYTTSRGLELRRGRGLYPDYLPTFDGDNVLTIIDYFIDEKGHVRLLDVGCGEGLFIFDLMQRYGEESLIADGISMYPYYDDRQLAQVGARASIRDIQRFHTKKKYDVIVSLQTLQYVPNPLQALKNIYNSLAVGGVALLEPIPFKFRIREEGSWFINFLVSEYGFEWYPSDVMLNKVSFRRMSHDRMRLPVRICGTHNTGLIPTGEHQKPYDQAFVYELL